MVRGGVVGMGVSFQGCCSSRRSSARVLALAKARGSSSAAVEGHDHLPVLRRPGVDLAPARGHEARQAVAQFAPQQAEHRLGARRAIVLGRGDHGDFGLLRKQGVRQALAKR
ncbi:hypothetical protein MASR1M50_09340 [Burkholderiales bacterium]